MTKTIVKCKDGSGVHYVEIGAEEEKAVETLTNADAGTVLMETTLPSDWMETSPSVNSSKVRQILKGKKKT